MERKKGVPPLRQLALQGCIRNHHFIHDVGDLPYKLVEPILKKLGAEQLEQVEKKCPQIRANSEPVWRGLIKRDFASRVVPDKHFKKTYGKYYREELEHKKDAAERLRLSNARHRQEKEAKKTVQLDNDPLAERQRAKQRVSKAGRPGSKSLQQTYNSLRAKGSLFSSKNIRFEPSNGTLNPPKPPPPPAPTPASVSPAAKPRPITNHVTTRSVTSTPKTASPIKKKEASIFLRRPKR